MKKLGRIDELDLLRGFFILVIIVDHLQRWPSPYTYITGEGRLWVSAAEGFFIISGLLIGYLRGFKQREVPIRELARKLWQRAGMLYLWTVGITLFVVSMTLLIPANAELLPKLPDADQTANLGTFIINVLTLNFATDWIYFLRFYAIMLFTTPLVIWLLRKNLWWVALLISLGLYGISFLFETPEGALQWQILFFVPALVGYKLQAIVHWLREHPRAKHVLMGASLVVTAATMVLSYFWVLGWHYVEAPDSSFSRETYVATRSWLDPWFTKAPLAIGRVFLAFVWFAGLVSLFHIALPYLRRWFGWLLGTFGTLSLSAYCLQAVVLVFVQVYLPLSSDKLVNALSTTLIVVAFWALLKIPFLRRLLPR